MIQVVFVMLVAAVLFVTLLLTRYGGLTSSSNAMMEDAAAQLVLLVFDRLGLAMLGIMVASALYRIFFSHASAVLRSIWDIPLTV